MDCSRQRTHPTPGARGAAEVPHLSSPTLTITHAITVDVEQKDPVLSHETASTLAANLSPDTSGPQSKCILQWLPGERALLEEKTNEGQEIWEEESKLQINVPEKGRV